LVEVAGALTASEDAAAGVSCGLIVSTRQPAVSALDRLYLQFELDAVADYGTAGPDRLDPVPAPVLAVDLGRPFETGARAEPWVIPHAEVGHRELDQLGGTANGQVTNDRPHLRFLRGPQLDTTELDRGVRLGLEEGGATKVRVATRGTCLDAVRRNRDRHLGLLRVRGVEARAADGYRHSACGAAVELRASPQGRQIVGLRPQPTSLPRCERSISQTLDV
jgi:hypothetical protein